MTDATPAPLGEVGEIEDLRALLRRAREYAKTGVLIVDDEETARTVLERYVTDAGMRPIEAESSAEAIRAAVEDEVDVILLDIMMPETDGFETCRQLKENPATKEIPVIFCTARRRKEDVITAGQVGAVGYVVKPFDREAVISKIEEAIGSLRRTILIVDDAPHIRKLIRRHLAPSGYRLLDVGSGMEALQALRSEKEIDLVLLDLMMPRVDGYEILARIHDDPDLAKIPVICCTAKREKEDVIRTRQLGAAGYIIKPFKGEQILAKVREVLGEEADDDSEG